jgi:hypothetical protein
MSVAIVIFGEKSSKITRFDFGLPHSGRNDCGFPAFHPKPFGYQFIIQTILVIAYFPVVKCLFETRVNTEPFLIWIGMLIAPVLSLLLCKGLLASIYSVRSIICVGSLLLMMGWIELIHRKNS